MSLLDYMMVTKEGRKILSSPKNEFKCPGCKKVHDGILWMPIDRIKKGRDNLLWRSVYEGTCLYCGVSLGIEMGFIFEKQYQSYLDDFVEGI